MNADQFTVLLADLNRRQHELAEQVRATTGVELLEASARHQSFCEAIAMVVGSVEPEPVERGLVPVEALKLDDVIRDGDELRTVTSIIPQPGGQVWVGWRSVGRPGSRQYLSGDEVWVVR